MISRGNAVVNYTAREIPYTRVIEHKHFEYGKQPHTVITYEYPDTYEPGKEPYYPSMTRRMELCIAGIRNWPYSVRM